MMKKFKQLALVIMAFFTLSALWAQNTGPGYRYGSAYYRIMDVDTDAPTATIEFEFKFEADASANATFQGGSVVLSTITTFPFELTGAVSVNFGAGSGTASLDAMVVAVENGVAYIEVDETRIYDLTQVSGDIIVNFLDVPRSGLPGVGLSGDTDPLTPFDNRDAFFVLNLIIPAASLGILENYESPISDVGNFTRRAVGNTSASIELDATTDESVLLDSYGISPDFASGLVAGSTQLEEGGVTNFNLDATSGLITFNTVNATPGIYPLQIVSADERGGATTNDFFVEIIPQCSTVPTFEGIGNVTATGGTTEPSQPFDLNPGSTFTLNVEVASGETPATDVLVQTSSLPAGATFVEDPSNPDNYIFTWTPSANSQNVNLSVFATDVDQNGDKICESAEIRYKLRVTTVECNDPAVIKSASIANIDQPASPPAGLDPSKYYPGISTGIDITASVTGRNSTFVYEWELTGPSVPVVLVGFFADIDDVVIPTGYDNFHLTITDINLANCFYEFDIAIPFGSLVQCEPSDDIVAIVDASNAGAGCGEEELTYYDGVSGPITLEAQVTAGLTGPFTYLWSTGEITETIDVSPTANTTYTVDITDANGCTATASADVIYCDARAYKKNGSIDSKKVTICHYPPGNPGNVQTITISINALCTHITQHNGPGAQDQIGDCDCGSTNKRDIVDYTEVTALSVFPNPTNGNFKIEYNLPEDGDVSLVLTDITGRTVYQESFSGSAGLYEHSLDLANQVAGLYLLKVTLNADEYTVKVNLLK